MGPAVDPVKLIGVAHLHIFARCPVVIIQAPGVIAWWSLVHWSGIAPLIHVLVFTTQVKVRVHVDQVGELIVQTSEMIPNSSKTFDGFQLTTALNNS